MCKLNFKEIDYKGELAVEARKTHKNIVMSIEQKVGKKLPWDIRHKIINGNNLAYLHFEGYLDGTSSKSILWAHSKINNSKKTEAFNELFRIYYCTPSGNPIIKSGSVNEKNDTLTFNEGVKKDFEGNVIYNRNNDSESKLIERFLKEVGDCNIEGELFLYTTLGPCLSCHKKIATLVGNNFGKMNRLSINVRYCTDYSNKNFA